MDVKFRTMVLVDEAEGFMLSDMIRDRSSRSCEVDVRRREREARVGEVLDMVIRILKDIDR